LNQYSVDRCRSPTKHANVHQQAAQKFAEFLLSPEVQKVIASFGSDRYGQPLFFVLSDDNAKR
jgi:tungstate transport system substrate-binding protein